MIRPEYSEKPPGERQRSMSAFYFSQNVSDFIKSDLIFGHHTFAPENLSLSENYLLLNQTLNLLFILIKYRQKTC